MQDLAKIRQDLIDDHARRITHLKGASGSIARTHFAAGVNLTLEAVARAAVEGDKLEQQPPEQRPEPSITGPLAR